MTNSLKIVYYHTISDSELEYFPKETTQTASTFAKQVRFLKRRFNIISIDEALNKASNGEKFNNHLVITTDDGFKENYTVIAPILNEHNVSFTALLCNDFLDNQKLMWRNVLFLIQRKFDSKEISKAVSNICNEHSLERPRDGEGLMGWSFRAWSYEMKDILAEALWTKLSNDSLNGYLEKTQPYLTSKQVEELLSSGFTIGSHSKSHPYFANLTENQTSSESVDAANQLEAKFNTKVKAFSFPFERPAIDSLSAGIEVLRNRFDVILGIHDNGSNNSNHPHSWERISMEFGYLQSVTNLYLSPLRQRWL